MKYVSLRTLIPLLHTLSQRTCESIPSFPQTLAITSIHQRATKILSSPISKLEQEERESTGIWTNVNDISFKVEGELGMPIQEEDDYENMDEEYLDDEEDEESYGTHSYEKAVYHNPEERDSDEQEDEMEEHPLRMDEWLVKVKLSPMLFPGNREADLFPEVGVDGHVSSSKQNRSGSKQKRKHQVLKFSKNGYVVLMEDSNDDSDDVLEHRRVTKIGKWKIDTSGVSWSIPVRSSDGSSQKHEKSTMLHYHADIHLSKFQEQPRMFRGVVTRDRFHAIKIPGIAICNDLFRPVIATFTADGIGKDTVDTSYKKRGFGLKGGNA